MGSGQMGRHWSTEERRKYQPCGRSKGSKRKSKKCVPLAKATRMSKGQKASAVKRKEQPVILAVNQLTSLKTFTELCARHMRMIMKRRSKGNMPARNKKKKKKPFRSTKSGAGMTRAGVAAYRRKNPGSKLKTAVTGKVKPGSKLQIDVSRTAQEVQDK